MTQASYPLPHGRGSVLYLGERRSPSMPKVIWPGVSSLAPSVVIVNIHPDLDDATLQVQWKGAVSMACFRPINLASKGY